MTVDREYQYRIPAKLDYLTSRYSKVTWSQANRLYAIAVEAVLSIFDVEAIMDVPFGKGYEMAKKMFENFLELAEKEKEEIEEEEDLNKGVRSLKSEVLQHFPDANINAMCVCHVLGIAEDEQFDNICSANSSCEDCFNNTREELLKMAKGEN